MSSASNGSNTDELTAEFVLASLCAKSTDLEVRDCLRKYVPSQTLSQQTKALNRLSKDVLVKTADYLEICTSGLLKDAVVHRVICKIQNLLPDTCQLCNEKYKFSIGEKPFLACKLCGQEVHKQCFLVLLGIDANSEVNINPHNLPGIHYLCQACETRIIPQKNISEAPLELPSTQAVEDALFAPARVEKPQTNVSSQRPTDVLSTPDVGHSAPASNFVDSSQNSAEQIQTQDTSNTQVLPDNSQQAVTASGDDSNVKKSKICVYYQRNQCKHGIKGKNCSFLHPLPCKKLLTHGTKQPDGCNLGKKCTSFHPKMCPTSITKRTCYDQKCKFAHVKGTVRKMNSSPSTKVSPKQKTDAAIDVEKTSSDPDITHPSFLELVNLLKKELSEAIDTKISMVISQLQVPRMQQFYPLQQYQMNPYQPVPPQFPSTANQIH